MAILEPEDFDKVNDPEWVKMQRKADKLKRIRIKQRQDEEAKSQFGIPTSLELEQQFYHDSKGQDN